MGLTENLKAVRSNLSGHSQDFFIFFFEKYPQHQNLFDEYKGKKPESLKSVARFSVQSTRAVTLLLETLERSADTAALKVNAKRVAKMPQHGQVGMKEYKDVFDALLLFLQDKLGDTFDRTAWETAGKRFIVALQAEM